MQAMHFSCHFENEHCWRQEISGSRGQGEEWEVRGRSPRVFQGEGMVLELGDGGTLV